MGALAAGQADEGWAPARGWGRPLLLGCFWVTDRPFPVEAVEALESEGVYLGWSALVNGGWTIKALGGDALTTRKLLGRLREVLYAAMQRSPPRLGRF